MLSMRQKYYFIQTDHVKFVFNSNYQRFGTKENGGEQWKSFISLIGVLQYLA